MLKVKNLKKRIDIEGKANFTLGEHPTKAPDISGTANYSLGSYPKTAPTIFGTAVYTKKDSSFWHNDISCSCFRHSL